MKKTFNVEHRVISYVDEELNAMPEEEVKRLGYHHKSEFIYVKGILTLDEEDLAATWLTSNRDMVITTKNDQFIIKYHKDIEDFLIQLVENSNPPS